MSIPDIPLFPPLLATKNSYISSPSPVQNWEVTPKALSPDLVFPGVSPGAMSELKAPSQLWSHRIGTALSLTQLWSWYKVNGDAAKTLGGMAEQGFDREARIVLRQDGVATPLIDKTVSVTEGPESFPTFFQWSTVYTSALDGPKPMVSLFQDGDIIVSLKGKTRQSPPWRIKNNTLRYYHDMEDKKDFVIKSAEARPWELRLTMAKNADQMIEVRKIRIRYHTAKPQ